MSHFLEEIGVTINDMNLLIVEDEALLRDKYTQYLQDHFSLDQVSGFYEAKEALKEKEYDVILLDYHLPDGRGIELAKDLNAEHRGSWAPVIVMITAYSEESLAIESLNIGVFRYLEKPIDREELKAQMLLAKSEAEKREQLSHLASQFLLSEKCKKILEDEHFISERELEVIEKILLHGKNKVVGEKLFISQGTVRNHLSNIFQKLHIGGKDQLRDLILKYNS